MIKVNDLKKETLKLTLFFIILAMFGSISFAAETNFYHQYIMRGSIIEVNGNDIYLCIGKKDGAQVGQELDVIHIEVKRNTHTKRPPQFKRVKVGRVRITEILDEHFARATIISGKATTNDIVELENPGK